MIQVPPSGDSSGWPDGYEDLESGDNGFPGDMDEGTLPSSADLKLWWYVFVCRR